MPHATASLGVIARDAVHSTVTPSPGGKPSPSFIKAIAPETTAVDMEVPLALAISPPGYALVIETPGAANRIAEPPPEKLANVPESSMAATPATLGDTPG